MGGFIYGGVPLAELEAAGEVEVDGDRSLAERLPGLFPLPETAPKPEN